MRSKDAVFIWRFVLLVFSSAADWKLDEPAWSGRMKITAKGKMAFIKLEDKNTGKWSGISLQLCGVGEALCMHLNPVGKVYVFKDAGTRISASNVTMLSIRVSKLWRNFLFFIFQWLSVPLNKCEGMIDLVLRNPSRFSHKTEWDSLIVYKTATCLFGMQLKQVSKSCRHIASHLYFRDLHREHSGKGLQQNS